MKTKNGLLIYPILLLGLVLILSNSCKKDSTTTNNAPAITFKDADGNVYDTVHIGTQVWMAENLKTTRLNDGATPIQNITDATQWTGTTGAAYCWYNNDAATNKNTYGALYNYYAVNTGKLCPSGWHVPTNDEWSYVSSHLGSSAGKMLKESGTTHWTTPNTGTNSTGFTALPGGVRRSAAGAGAFQYINTDGMWWSSTMDGTSLGWSIYIYYNYDYVSISGSYLAAGQSVRCIMN